MLLLFTALIALPALADLPASSLPAPGAYVNANGGPLIPLLQNARDKIDIEIYTMNDQLVRTQLRAALKRGVKVRIVKDPNPFGSRCDVFGTAVENAAGPDSSDCADQQKLVRDVRDAGGVYVPFDKKTLCPNGGGVNGDGCFQHGKIAVVDDLALLSTGNFDGTNLCIESERPRTCNRDYSLVIADREIIGTLERIFEADVAAARYDVSSLIPPSLADRLTVSPVSLKPIVDFIDGARSTLDVETQYLKDPELNAAIVRAAKRGVRVTVTTASACSFGKPTESAAKEVRDVYSAFDAAGVESRMFTAASIVNGHAGYMHAKAIVVDGARAWVGSVNGSTESLTQNREFGLIFDQHADVLTVQGQIRADFSDRGDESWQESLTCVKDRAGHAAPAPILLPIKKPGKKKRVAGVLW